MTLPEGWREVQLGDLVEVLDGRRVPVSAPERAKRRGAVPYYGAAGQVGWIDSALFDEDLILLGEDGVQFFDPHREKAYRISGPAWVNNHAHVLRSRAVVDWRFLTYLLNQADYRGYANGTTRLKLTQAAMRRIPVRLPQLDEQRRIVEILEEHLSRLEAAEIEVVKSVKRVKGWSEASLRDALRAGERASFRDLYDVAALPAKNVEVRTAPATGRWRVVDQGDGAEVRTDDASTVFVGRLPVVVFGDHTRRIKFVREEFAVGGSGVKLLTPRAGLDPEFAYWAARAAAVPPRGYGRHFAIFRAADFRTGDAAFQRFVIATMLKVVDAERLVEAAAVQASSRSAALRRALLHAAFSGQLTGRSSDLDRAEEFVS